MAARGSLMEEVQQGFKSHAGFDAAVERRRRKGISTWARLRRSPSAMIGLALIGLLLLTALAANMIAVQGINDQDLRKALLPPGADFPLGTDELGRDMLSRIIYGSR
ncbi:MAG: hypothetical protein Q7W05_10610, partial [Deltaproteobacteria bacterium]|nr:hypothetical protein [Deltaproteobacteria bacterium]